MTKRNVIVIGTSAGSGNSVRAEQDLPKDLDAAVFVVTHIDTEARGIRGHRQERPAISARNFGSDLVDWRGTG